MTPDGPAGDAEPPFSAARGEFTLFPRLKVERLRFGRSQEPILRIDDVLADPEEMLAFADAQQFVAANGDFYPGLKAPAPAAYVERLARALDPIIRQTWGLADARLVSAQSNMALVTQPPETLRRAQRVPHIDTHYPWQFALLHYFCAPLNGGTAFYRQHRSGLERISVETDAAYRAARDVDLALLSPVRGYPGMAIPGYDRIAHFDALPNRLLVYRSCILHSGVIGPTASLSTDPRLGRLTVNSFINYNQMEPVAGAGHPIASGTRLHMQEREVKDLCRANEILRKASTNFAQAEFDRRDKW